MYISLKKGEIEVTLPKKKKRTDFKLNCETFTRSMLNYFT